MAAVQIKLDQAATPPGVAGVAREDFVLGADVTAIAVGGPYSAYLWSIVDKPIDIVAGTRSASLLTNAMASATLITPIDLAGTWNLQLLVDSGHGLGATPEDQAVITFYAGPALNPDPTLLPRREIAFREQLQHNVADVIFPAGNSRGWAQEWSRWFALLRSIANGKSHAWGRVTLAGGGASFAAPTCAFNAAVARAGVGIVDVTFTTNAPNANYAAVATARGAAIGGSCTVSGEGVGGFRVHRADPGGALVDADFCFDVKARP